LTAKLQQQKWIILFKLFEESGKFYIGNIFSVKMRILKPQ